VSCLINADNARLPHLALRRVPEARRIPSERRRKGSRSTNAPNAFRFKQEIKRSGVVLFFKRENLLVF
jgi:hypothetical protein